ncbi:MAG: mechanosensitive ion channel family protein [Pseudomonadota bacterium]
MSKTRPEHAARHARRAVPSVTKLVALLCLVLAGWIGVQTAAQAQGLLLDYGTLLGTTTEDEPQQSRPQQSQPAQTQTSPPRRSSIITDGTGTISRPNALLTPAPTIDDYARVATTNPDSMIDQARQSISLFRARVRSIVQRLPEAWIDIKTTLAAAAPTGEPRYFIGVALFAGLLLIIGRSVALLFAYYVGRPLMIAAQKPNPIGYYGKMPILFYRQVLTIVAVVITMSVASTVGLFFYQEHKATQTTVVVVFVVYAATLLLDTLWRVIVAPYLSEYRLPHIDDVSARHLYTWLSAATSFGLVSMGFTYWMQALGLSPEMHTAITVCLSFITVLLLLVMIRIHRHTISGVILGGRARAEASWLSLLAVALWAPAVSIYLLVTWGDMSFRLIMGISSDPLRLMMPYLIFMSGLLVYAIAAYIIERLFSRSREIAEINRQMDEQRAREEEAADAALRAEIMARADGAGDIDNDGDEEAGGAPIETADPNTAIIVHQRPGMRTMEDLARRVASLFAMGAVAYFLARFWGGPDVFERIPGLALAEDVIDTLFVGYIIYHAVRIWIDQKIAEEVGDEPDDSSIMEGEGGGAGATRLATLLPLIRNFVLIVIVVTVLLLIATDLGVNVAPLFAGAGIVGLAIGFGSQALVRDILSGAFFLADDAFRKGEYIDVGDVKGTVEKISLRSFQLRHHLGMLHTIPFGEIQFLTNFSRDWVMMKLPLRLTYDTDVERVRKLVKKLGLALLEDPEIGEKFIQPVKSQGVIMMDDSAMIVRIKFMTYPGEQWVLRKRIYAEIRELFEREGIKFAHREVTVRIPDLDENRQLTQEEKSAIGAAARRAADQVDEEAQMPAAVGGDVR